MLRSLPVLSARLQHAGTSSGVPFCYEEARQRIRARFLNRWPSVALIGAPINEGQPIGGVDKAPDAFRKAGLEKVVRNLSLKFEDQGNVPEAVCDDIARAESLAPETVKNSRSVGFRVGKVHEQVSAAAAAGKFALTVGGDHSIASGSITGIAKHHPDLAVVWVDAHADCNTPKTSDSKNYHGMPLAHILGWFDTAVPGFEWCDHHLATCGALAEERVALIGVRDLDGMERELVKRSGLNVFSMSDIDRMGIGTTMEKALSLVDPKGQRPLHLSFDVDGCDPSVAPGTGTLARGGLSYRESHYICEELARTDRLVSMDLVEVNPTLDAPQSRQLLHGDDPMIQGTATVSFGLELISSALGKAIL